MTHSREDAYVRCRCAGVRGNLDGWSCGWEGTLRRGPLDEAPRCPRCDAMTEAIGNTPLRAVEVPDRRCGCGPDVVQIECPYHGGAL